jgi:hypothetical protein
MDIFILATAEFCGYLGNLYAEKAKREGRGDELKAILDGADQHFCFRLLSYDAAFTGMV